MARIWTSRDVLDISRMFMPACTLIAAYSAAKANDVLFYPINPGREEQSWERFHDEAADIFFDGVYAGGYERERIDEFLACLPEVPPWKL